MTPVLVSSLFKAITYYEKTGALPVVLPYAVDVDVTLCVGHALYAKSKLVPLTPAGDISVGYYL